MYMRYLNQIRGTEGKPIARGSKVGHGSQCLKVQSFRWGKMGRFWRWMVVGGHRNTTV